MCLLGRGTLQRFSPEHSCSQHLLSEKGTDMITPLLVPIQILAQEISMAVTRTNENPSFTVPVEIEKLWQMIIK